MQAGIACRRRLLGHDPTLDMDRRACVGGLAWMMPGTEWLGGSETIATARRNTIYHNECRAGGVGFDQQTAGLAMCRCGRSQQRARRYAPICGAATGDPCRSQTPSKWCSVGGGKLHGGGYLEATGKTTWTGAVECGPAALVRIRHKRQHAGTDARPASDAQGLGYGRRA